MTNVSLSLNIIRSLQEQGLNHFVVCAGARSAPFMAALESVNGIEVDYYFEERAAAFYAMGIAKATTQPVAVVTTSGTAVAELHPAIMEAGYSGIPLVAITADRPAHYRGAGAPQSVYQPMIFADHVAASYDFSVHENNKEAQLFKDRPVHINICFDEPLLDEEPEQQNYTVKSSGLASGFNTESFNTFVDTDHFTRPLVILGSLKKEQREQIKESLLNLNVPIYAEAHSGLREDPDLQSFIVKSGEYSFRPKVFKSSFNSVIRIGGVPCLRLWRDLETSLVDTPVASFSDLPLTGLSRAEHVAPINELPLFLQSLDLQQSAFDDKALRLNLSQAREIYPESEVSLLSNWANSLPEEGNILLGNSLPIREWEIARNFQFKNHNIYANRGVNGIDGLIATACGVARGTQKKTYVVLGDLSALYDLSSLALVSKMNSLVKVVVINNGGGMIFRRVFNNSRFENRHDLNFSQAGKMFGLTYSQKLEEPADILEIRPDAEQSDMFWKAYYGECQ